MPHRSINLAFGFSGGFSFAALLEWLASPSVQSALAFLGSFVSAGVGLYLSRKASHQEADRLAMEQRRYEQLSLVVVKLAEKWVTDAPEDPDPPAEQPAPEVKAPRLRHL